MTGLPEPLSRLIGELKRLPGIGEKSAQRIAFHLLQGGPERAAALGAATSTLHEQVSRCGVCGNFTDAQPCGFCRNPGRGDTMLCVVEDPADIAAIEKAKIFNGRYHVLGGVTFPRRGIPRRSAAWPACCSASATAGSRRSSWPRTPPTTAKPPPPGWRTS